MLYEFYNKSNGQVIGDYFQSLFKRDVDFVNYESFPIDLDILGHQVDSISDPFKKVLKGEYHKYFTFRFKSIPEIDLSELRTFNLYIYEDDSIGIKQLPAEYYGKGKKGVYLVDGIKSYLISNIRDYKINKILK